MNKATYHRKPKLQGKATRVLAIIVAKSPDVVTRDELIAEVWAGNHLVGERGLNQALWAIRSELGDDARNPTYIKTLAREGYQWLGGQYPYQPRNGRMAMALAFVASICVIALTTMTVSSTEERDFTLPSQCEINEKSDVQAYRVNRDVIVDIEKGCRLIAKPSGSKSFGSPLVSDDGRQVAFTVTEDKSCHFVTIDLAAGKRTEFDSCTMTN